MFDTILEPTAVLLLAVAAIGLLISLTYGLGLYRRAASFGNYPLPGDSKRRPRASVLVYCQHDEEVLADCLAQLAAQDYPDYEVVVVCDASAEYAEYLNEKYKKEYTDLYVTFVQPGSHNLSRRKLAITIGAKAAKGEILVLTVANIILPSEQWLSSIMAPFCGEEGKHRDVVLGLSRIDFGCMHGPGKWYRQFDSLLTNALWIGSAANGDPYRGDGYNLAFRRDVFFRNKGFARTINLHYGDDDLFIHEISTGANTVPVINSESIILTDWGDAGNRVWSILKERYSFTSRWLPHGPFVRSAIQMALQWIIPGAAVAAAIISLPNLVPSVVAILFVLLFWGVEIACYRRLAARCGAVRLWWAVVPFWLWRPLADFWFRYDHRHSRKKNFTWQR